MRPWGILCMKTTRKYEGGANSRSEISPNVYEVGAPLDAYLHYHHEMAYVNTSVK